MIEIALVLDIFIFFLVLAQAYFLSKMIRSSRDMNDHHIKTWLDIDRRIDREVYIIKRHSEHLLTCINDLHDRISLLEATKISRRRK